jgi:hypothetical protein
LLYAIFSIVKLVRLKECASMAHHLLVLKFIECHTMSFVYQHDPYSCGSAGVTSRP